MKLYFSEDNDEFCHPLWYYDVGLILFEARIVRNENIFFCKFRFEAGEHGDCGKHCKAYDPRNKKSGICKWHGFAYEKTDKKTINK